MEGERASKRGPEAPAVGVEYVLLPTSESDRALAKAVRDYQSAILRAFGVNLYAILADLGMARKIEGPWRCQRCFLTFQDISDVWTNPARPEDRGDCFCDPCWRALKARSEVDA